MILPQQRVLGGDFFNKVCGHLKLLEKEYFGLEFRHHNGNYVRTPDARGRRVEALRGALKLCLSLQVWLELLKPLAKQIKCKFGCIYTFLVKYTDLTHLLLSVRYKRPVL